MLSLTDQIDLVLADGSLVLVVEKGELDQPEAVRLFSDKLNTYAVFALDGEMDRQYPGLVSQRKRLILFAESLPSWTEAVLPELAASLGQQGLPLYRELAVSSNDRPALNPVPVLPVAKAQEAA